MLLEEVCSKHLQPAEKLMLRDLISFPLITIDMFINTLYGDLADGGPETADRTINVRIHHLRKKINKNWVIIRFVNRVYTLRKREERK